MNVQTARRDAVFQTLRFEQPEVCPYYVWVDKEMAPSLAAHYGPERFIDHGDGTCTFDASYTAWHNIVALPVSNSGDTFVDEYGCHLRRWDAFSVEKPALPEPSLEGYTFPDMADDAHFRHMDAWCTQHAERFRIIQLGILFWERTWLMRGMENICMDLVLNPAFAEALFAGLEEVCTRVIDRLLTEYGDRIDAIGFSEDYGTQRGLIIGPTHWRRFVKPGLARMVERIRAGGKKVYLHSCGHIVPLIPELIDIGVDILQPIQPEAMDIFELKRQFGRDICLMGGISTQYTLHSGKADDVRREVADCLEKMAAGGGYVMAPAKAILPGVPVENAIALIDAFLAQNGS